MRGRIMSTLRSILLHFDASTRSANRLLLCRDVAALHDAQVTALYATIPSVYSVPYVMADGGAELLPLLQKIDTDRRNEARALFDRAVSSGTSKVIWRELDTEPLIPGVISHALCADLLVFGQHDPADPSTTGIPGDLIASVMIGSGRPSLVIPYLDICASVGQNILIAWKPTREAAHAVSAAIPFLRRARRVNLVADDGYEGDGGGAASVVDYLRLHGVTAPIERRSAVPSKSSGEALLSLASDVEADLLVMGCYGHSRARELVLGGASRTVLDSMTLPVLMAH
jgi:nucleotide-binding universal stress UspA family protein